MVYFALTNKSRLLGAVCACVFALITTTAKSALVEVDLVASSGDALLTRDTSTGLEWLDITETANLSYNDVIGGVGNDWVTAQGFRYATAAEVDHFFREAGWDGVVGWRVESYAAADNILDLWGAYSPLGAYHYLQAMTSDGTESEKWYATVSMEHPDYDQGNVMPWTPYWPYETGAPVHISVDYRNTVFSQALVRPEGWVAPVPIPPALWLFGSGLLGLIGIARRKKAA